METIYEWLLHNVGNEGNYLTILNVQRQTNEAGIPRIDVMARTKDFAVVTLSVTPREATMSASANELSAEGNLFATEEGVIDYLSEGRVTRVDTTESGIWVNVPKPTGGTESLAFPPER